MWSVKERLQIKRTALDKWSTKEHLCLASAVSCSGDQNWMSVSRSLKLMCASHNRPLDWFSQKSCAVQFGELLENVETPKRKKRNNSDNNQSQTAETPTESILRNLKQERIAELEVLIQKERDEYSKIYQKALSLQNNTATDDEIREMWSQLQREKEQQVIEEQKYNEWLKERENRKLELQRAWRPLLSTAPNQSTSGTGEISKSSLASNLTQEDMDIDETITTTSSISSIKQHPQPGISPLLTSLLKSPSPTVTTTNSMHSSTARVAAPTITNLLTGGVSGQLQVPSTSNIQQQPFKIIQTQPLTGPPIQTNSSSHIAQSPSQAAPTLSMLLENKNSNKETFDSNQESEDSKSQDIQLQQQIESERNNDGSDSPNKDELMEVFKGLIDENIDENIDELAEILTNNNAIPEILDEDLDNVDLEDDSQDAALIGDDVMKQEKIKENDSKNIPEFFNPEKTNKEIIKLDQFITESNDLNLKEKQNTTEKGSAASDSEVLSELVSSIKEDKEESENSVQFVETKEETQDATVEPKSDKKSESLNLLEESNFKQNFSDNEKDEKKFEISEDSGDITFQEIANQIKEKIKAEEGQESKESSDDVMEITDNLQSVQSIESDDKKSTFTFEDSQDAQMSKNDSFRINTNEKVENVSDILGSDDKNVPKKSVSESSDIIIIPEDEDSNDKQLQKSINKDVSVDSHKNVCEEKQASEQKLEMERSILKSELDRVKNLEPTTITIIDTDDDSTNMETKDEKTENISSTKTTIKSQLSINKSDSEMKKPEELDDIKLMNIRKFRDCDGSESPLVDEELNESQLRNRRRYSSTPVIDSIPNSPASSADVGDQIAWKKSVMAVYNRLLTNKNAQIFMRIPSEDQASKYKQTILRPIDLPTIKKNIESGTIRSTLEFQRDLLLMCQNAIMFYSQNSSNYNAAKEFLCDIKTNCFKILEKENRKDCDDKFTTSSQHHQQTQQEATQTLLTSVLGTSNISSSSNSAASLKNRIGSRKSQRF